MASHAVPVLVFTVSHAVLMVVFTASKAVPAVVLIPFHAPESIVVIPLHAVEAAELMVDHVLPRKSEIPVKTVVAVVLIPPHSPVKKLLMPFQTVSVVDWMRMGELKSYLLTDTGCIRWILRLLTPQHMGMLQNLSACGGKAAVSTNATWYPSLRNCSK